MPIYLTELSPNVYQFPSPHEALDDPNGLLAFGGGLEPERILKAYDQGIFPWYGPGEPILWWSPSPRAVFMVDEFKPSRSLKKFQRKTGYKVSINQATEEVLHWCAALRPARETWLNEPMKAAYYSLAKQGHCHSVEVWLDDELVGGLYGINRGGIFCGESMFSKKTNASKVALWYFCRHFQACNGKLIDCQVMNDHLESLGAIELPRKDFLDRLLCLKNSPIKPSTFDKQWLEDPTE